MQTYFHMKAFARRLILKHKAQSNLEMGYLKELQKSNHDYMMTVCRPRNILLFI